MLLAAPALILLVAAFAYPVFTILVKTFTDHTSSPGGVFANLSWYFGNSTQITILIRTFQTSFIVTAICLLVGYPFTYLITTVSKRWSVLLIGVVIMSFWQSLLVRNYAWRILLRDNGPVNDAIAFFGFGRLDLLGTTTGVTIAMAHVMAPFMILPLYAEMRTVDRRLVQAAKSLGANPVTAFFKVFLPLTVRGIMAGSLIVFVLSLGFYITPAIIGSPTNSLISQAIVDQTNRLLDWGHAGAMSLVLFTFTVVLIGVVAWLARRKLVTTAGGSKA